MLAAALQKRINRKRKGPSLESEDSQDAPQLPIPPNQQGPRQSGSMVSHHDDVITRMKNVDMIELGKHRIKPWYFAPYPQVEANILQIQCMDILICSTITGNGGVTMYIYLRILFKVPEK